MPQRTLVGYILLPSDKPWPEEGEQTVFAYDELVRAEWAVVVYTPDGVRGYSDIAERPGCEVTLIERGVICPRPGTGNDPRRGGVRRQNAAVD